MERTYMRSNETRRAYRWWGGQTQEKKRNRNRQRDRSLHGIEGSPLHRYPESGTWKHWSDAIDRYIKHMIHTSTCVSVNVCMYVQKMQINGLITNVTLTLFLFKLLSLFRQSILLNRTNPRNVFRPLYMIHDHEYTLFGRFCPGVHSREHR